MISDEFATNTKVSEIQDMLQELKKSSRDITEDITEDKISLKEGDVYQKDGTDLYQLQKRKHTKGPDMQETSGPNLSDDKGEHKSRSWKIRNHNGKNGGIFPKCGRNCDKNLEKKQRYKKCRTSWRETSEMKKDSLIYARIGTKGLVDREIAHGQPGAGMPGAAQKGESAHQCLKLLRGKRDALCLGLLRGESDPQCLGLLRVPRPARYDLPPERQCHSTPQQAQALGITGTPQQTQAEGIPLTSEQFKALVGTCTPEKSLGLGVTLIPEQVQALGPPLTSEQP
ncbi:hypothetical protein HPG69_015197 [Diceros bicornis minor]|uniref:FAM186A/B N-terminal domain-containing protein n=1 Tax=Diceros bicornis minor TaxID=77932 RepID=A0A7J7FKL1_DICBM|nr:hypothetical protein HPG69_015197 [Diceros bicornis minor]